MRSKEDTIHCTAPHYYIYWYWSLYTGIIRKERHLPVFQMLLPSTQTYF